MTKSDKKRPKLIVFDLDYTLWPFWMHQQIYRPFSKSCGGDKVPTIDHNSLISTPLVMKGCYSTSGIIIDSKGFTIEYYEEVPTVLRMLKRKGYILAIASATPNGKDAQQLFELFDWNKYFTYKEMHPGRKTEHFVRVRDQSGIPFEDMLFFDDELRNVYDMRNVGVVSVLVRDGVNKKLVQSGLNDYARERSYK